MLNKFRKQRNIKYNPLIINQLKKPSKKPLKKFVSNKKSITFAPAFRESISSYKRLRD